ncbi:MAG: diacylglycerol kinase family lipid kinase [Clostridiales bacterium]|jgi:YegS/Rv2252/BmrU family lipid kinase|nr:diacylglycerol kinase family lipid kinase [Clostridiales bacterium]
MHHIIVNPKAGRSRITVFLESLEKLFSQIKIEFKKHSLADANEFSDEDVVIGIGGDGTFQELASALFGAGKKNRFAIFPAGSGNDFAMSLESGKRAALSKYGKNAEHNARVFFEMLMRGETRSIDVITANGTAYLNIGNMGLDARIVQNAEVLKERFGRHAYLAAVYKSIARHKNLPLTIEVNGKKIEDEFTLIAVCNGQYYGGGMRIAPSASIDDGKITLCLVEGMPRPKTMILFPSILMERHTKLKIVKYIECESVKIISAGAETLCLDGNLYPCEDEIEFKIHPKAMDVFI